MECFELQSLKWPNLLLKSKLNLDASKFIVSLVSSGPFTQWTGVLPWMHTKTLCSLQCKLYTANTVRRVIHCPFETFKSKFAFFAFFWTDLDG